MYVRECRIAIKIRNVYTSHTVNGLAPADSNAIKQSEINCLEQA